MIRGAIADFIRHRTDVTWEEQAEAERWLFGDGEGALSFAWCCETLGLHPNTIRRAALHVEENPEIMSMKLKNDWDMS